MRFNLFAARAGRGLAGLLALLLTSCGADQETDNAQVQADISPVIPKVSAAVVGIRVSDNQRVRRGDTLVLLDDRDLKLRVTQAEIALAQARANVVVARKNSAAARLSIATVASTSGAATAGIATARATVESARARLRQTTQNFQRQAALLAQQSATQQSFDNARADRDGAAASLAAAEAQVKVLTGQAGAATNQVATARSQADIVGQSVTLAQLAVRQAEAALATARLLASYTVITAPAAGVVSDRNLQLGQLVTPGQTLMKVAQDGNLWVVANFKETQLEKMKVGQPVEIKADTYSGKVFQGKVQSLSPATGARYSLLPPDNATGNFVKVTQRVPVKIVFTEPPAADTPLRAGMSVTANVKEAQ